jgi:hypothetical protein
MSWARIASVEETLALWAVSLREIKQRIRPLFTQERVATNAGLFLESLLEDEQRRTGWMRAEAAGDHREQIGVLNSRLLAIVRDDEVCRRLMTMPALWWC